MGTVVAIHNAVNERAWSEVRRWQPQSQHLITHADKQSSEPHCRQYSTRSITCRVKCSCYRQLSASASDV